MPRKAPWSRSPPARPSEQRYQVGLIAITDVQEARAAHDSSAADVIAAKRQLSSSLEALREITGDLFDNLARPIEPFELSDPTPSARTGGLIWPCSKIFPWSRAGSRRTLPGTT